MEHINGHDAQTTREAAGESLDRYMSSDPLSASLTRFELAFLRLHGAFAGWAMELQKFVSGSQLSFQEAMLLHCVRLRGGTTTIAEMMLYLHRNDLAAISYNLRKLEQYGVIKRLKTAYRREVAYSLTEEGRRATSAFGRIRHETLVQLCSDVGAFQESTNQASAIVERLIGVYDQATRSILNQHVITDSTAAQTPIPAKRAGNGTKRSKAVAKKRAQRG